MKTYELSAFSGVRNDVSLERFDSPNKQTGLTDLSAAVNIELDETGKPACRLGATVLDAVSSHSLWADDELAYLVRAGTLHQLNPDLSVTDLGIAIAGSRVVYTRLVNDVYFSDGLITGVVGGNGYRPWGIVTPRPVVNATLGALRAGTYLVTTTYVRRSGLESGASRLTSITCVGSEGIEVTMPPSTDPLVDGWNVYVSDCNGEVPYLCATLTSSDAAATITQLPASRTRNVRTLRCGPPPPGQVLCYYKGRIYIAENNYLWYSLPYQYELVHRAMNFLPFTSPIKTLAACSDGLYVGSDDETVFLQGDDPAEFTRRIVAPYGTVLGTEMVIPAYQFGKGDNPTPVAAWMSKKGLCAGLDGGQFMNLTGDRYVPPAGVATGASLLKVRGESPQLVTTLFS